MKKGREEQEEESVEDGEGGKEHARQPRRVKGYRAFFSPLPER